MSAGTRLPDERVPKMDSGSSKYEDGRYAASHPTWHREDSAWKAERILEIFRRNHLTPSEICEVGCGAGEILNCLRRELPPTTQFHGYEISPQAIELCISLADERLSFITGISYERRCAIRSSAVLT